MTLPLATLAAAFSPVFVPTSSSDGPSARIFECQPGSASFTIPFGPRTIVDGQGLRIEADGHVARLRTRSFGREDREQALGGGSLRIDVAYAELERPALIEWFAPGERGLEQGWTIAQRPEGESALWIGLALEGDLSLHIAENGRSALLVDARGGPAASYQDLVVVDAGGRELDARLTSSPGGAGIRVDDRDALYPITIDPWIAGPYWVATNVRAASAAGDVNADGFGDVIALDATNGVLVFHGSAGGLASTPSTTFHEPGQNGFARVATAGDVNGDGYADVVIGAPQHNFGYGKVYLYAGSASGIATTHVWSFDGGLNGGELGSAVAYAGDINGDGLGDFAFGEPVWSSGFTPGHLLVALGSVSFSSPVTPYAGIAGSGIGASIFTAGDVDADGYDDVLVGAPQSTPGGSTYLLRGTSATTSSFNLLTSSTTSAANHGRSVGGGGDVNGDGYTDVVIGAPNEGVGGRVTIYSAHTNTLLRQIDGNAGDFLGESTAIVGDVNGDGFADVATWGAGNRQLRLYLGSPSTGTGTPDFTFTPPAASGIDLGTVVPAGDVNGDGYGDFLLSEQSNGSTTFLFYGHATMPTTPAWTRESGQFSSNLGQSVSHLGDVNGDGIDDIAVAASNWTNDQTSEGRVYVFAGGTNGASTTPLSIVEGNQAFAHFGSSVAGIGDLDADGYADLVAGSPTWTNGQAQEGAVFVYRGSPTGFSPTPTLTIESGIANTHFGSTVASAGDVNGDGFADTVVGWPDCFLTAAGEGAVWLVLGGSSGLDLAHPWIKLGGQAGAHFGDSVAAAGDVDGDGYGDLIVGAPDFQNGQVGEGCVYLFRGSSTGLSSTPAITIEGDFPNIHWGRHVAGIGDVNGDSLDDVAIGCPNCYSSSSDEGEVWVYHGSPTGLVTATAWVANSGQLDARLGSSVSAAGDVNGDGYGDLLAGARGFDSPGGNNNGRVYLWLGSASGLASSPAWTYEDPQASAELGASVSSAGDINGDGFADLLFGAPYHDGSVGTDEGKVFLVQGNTLGAGSNFRSGVKQIARQQRPDESRYIAFDGTAYSPNGFSLRLSCAGANTSSSTAVGRTKVHWQVQARERAIPFSSSGGFGAGGWSDTGLPSGSTPVSIVSYSFVPPSMDRCWKWRTRVVIQDPFVPCTPWVSLSGRSLTEPKFRTARDCNGNDVADHVEITNGTQVDLDRDLVLDACESAGTPYCFGDGSSGICPCNNYSTVGAQSGCLNSLGLAGRLIATGNASVMADSVTLNGTGMPNANALYFQGNATSSTTFGDGIRCATGGVKRLGTKTNVGNASRYPESGDASIHVRGEVPAAGGTRYYQAWYRNAATFCASETFNLTNGVSVVWSP